MKKISLILLCCFWITACQSKHACVAYVAGKTYQCALGQNGVTVDKKEGDGKTPVGEFVIRKIFYRPDRMASLKTQVPTVVMHRDIGWCDDPRSPYYNQEVQLPFTASHEELWRNDHVYDVVAVVGYNDRPVVKNKGSAIFIHIAREGYTGTAGCIAFSKKDLLEILQKLGSRSTIKIDANGKVFFAPVS